MKYALALAGGGTRGAFEVGVWQALGELGIEIEAIAGTSIGAVNGAVFASGLDAQALWKNIKATDIADIKGENLFSPTAFLSAMKNLPSGGIDVSAFKIFLTRHIDENAVRNSRIDFGLCAYRTDTKNCEELFSEQIPDGKLVDYILASACFPMFKPMIIDGIEYSDGAVRNNLPVNMLIERGYDTIISVSVKGIGMLKSIDKCGVNIINIKCHTPEIGIMDFDTESIGRSIKSGYFECMRVFGRYCGKIYPISCDSYHEAKFRYGRDIITGIEEAAAMCGIDKFRVYDFPELTHAVFSEYKHCKKLYFFVRALRSKRRIRAVLDSFGKYFRAANSIIYLNKHKYENFP